MATPSLGGHNVPDSMKTRGQYKYHDPQPVHTNGAGAPVFEPYTQITWSWSALTQTEYDFLATTVLSSALSATLSTAELWNGRGSEYTFNDVVMTRPTFDYVRSNIWWNVELTLTQVVVV